MWKTDLLVSPFSISVYAHTKLLDELTSVTEYGYCYAIYFLMGFREHLCMLTCKFINFLIHVNKGYTCRVVLRTDDS